MDQGDLYLNGNVDERHALNYLGNTHGGMVELNGDWYIFYHRQTNQHSYSRQACAERLVRTPEGGFKQAEVTSCGLNGGPLRGKGEYPARIACNLWSKEGTARYDQKFKKKLHPYFTQDKRDDDHDAVQYIANMRDGAVAGFKYFDMQDAKHIRASVGGKGNGTLEVSHTPGFETLIASILVNPDNSSINGWSVLTCEKGKQALFFRYKGEGYIDFYAFELS